MPIKRILLTCENYYPKAGGIQQFVQGLAEFLTEAGIEVLIYTQSYPELKKEGTEKLPEATVFYSNYMEAAMSNPFSVIKYKNKFSSFLMEHKIDLVFANNHNSLAWILAAKKVKVTVIYGLHGVGLMCPLKIRFLKPNSDICYEASINDCTECFFSLRKQEEKSKLRTLIGYLLFFTWRAQGKPNYWRYVKARRILNLPDLRYGNSKLSAGLFTEQNNTIGFPLAINASQRTRSNWYRPQVNEQLLAQYNLEYKNFILCSGRIHETKGQLYAVEALQYLNGQQVLVLTGSNIDNPNSSVSRTYLQIIKDRISELDLGKRVVFTNT
ncbi:glycosyltransferase, partial [Candidatus Pacearchaeota archaeon]|nr:glycosyltransferase [Candidatus Pacearchaeota archaeon]